jgi:hypothetical protein
MMIAASDRFGNGDPLYEDRHIPTLSAETTLGGRPQF